MPIGRDLFASLFRCFAGSVGGILVKNNTDDSDMLVMARFCFSGVLFLSICFFFSLWLASDTLKIFILYEAVGPVCLANFGNIQS